jgi:hypothetical protein
MLFIVIERFRGASVADAYWRFKEHGRLAPPELKSIGSWVTADLSRCFQILEAEDPSLVQRWVAKWVDLIEFEIFPVIDGSAVARLFTGGVEAAAPA